jgi:RNA polymerase sigma-70 factor, ECF subfamily
MTDKQARFEAIARQYSADMYRYAMWISGDHALAKDVVQEAFVRAWKALDKLNDEKAIKGWLFTIVRREYLRTFERKVPNFVDVDDVVLTEQGQMEPEADSEVANLRQAIAALPAKYREPLMLQVIGGFSCNEIAEQLNISRSAVMTQLFRAREKLKHAMIDDVLKDNNVHELS